MFCGKCGTDIPEGDHFCGKCGWSLDSFATPENSEIDRKSKKIIWYAVIGAVILIAIVALTVYLSSPAFLEKQLCALDWYREPNMHKGSEYIYGSVIEFHSNGEAEVTHYMGEHGFRYNMHPGGSGKPYETWEWEILSDKTLLLDGEYYEWKKDWHISTGKLVIKEDIYYNENRSRFVDFYDES